jgi:hypothetical protein
MTFAAYGVCGLTLLVSLGVLVLSGMLASVLVHGAQGALEWGIAAASVGFGLAQVAAPAWLLWRTSQGNFGGWGVGLGVICLVVSTGLGALLSTAISAGAQP